MSLSELVSATNGLPYSLKDQVLGFATFVEDSADDLLESAGVTEISDSLIDELVFAAGMWRLWKSVNAQISLLDSSLTLLAASGVSEVRMGTTSYTRSSPVYGLLTTLRDDFRNSFRDGSQFIISSSSLTELVRNVVANSGR